MFLFQKNNFKTINAIELEKLLTERQNTPVLIDVREESELNDNLGHIHGIIHMPVGTIGVNLPKLESYKDKEIVVVCRSGKRASSAADTLQKSGFEKVTVLEGGMIAWRQAGL